MARVGYRVTVNEARLNGLLYGQRGEVANDLRRRGQAVLRTAKAVAPKRTGKMARSLKMTGPTRRGNRQEVTISSDLPYTVYVHEGTGLYAGRGYIYPRQARVLSWVDESGRRVYARRVRGQPAQPFLLLALAAFD